MTDLSRSINVLSVGIKLSTGEGCAHSKAFVLVIQSKEVSRFNLYSFFDNKEQGSKEYKQIQKMLQEIFKNTMNIQGAIEEQTPKLFKAIFEATEVKTPTCFIILPEKLPSGNNEDEKLSFTRTVTKVQSVLLKE